MTHESFARQAQKINEYRTRTEAFTKQLSGMDLVVLPNVFPGGTDTGLLCDTLQVEPGERVLDIGTGTGAVAIKAALLGAGEAWGTDINPEAIRNAQHNQAQLNLANLHFVVADVFVPGQPPFDVIAMNPPYTDAPAPDLTAACFWDEGNAVLKRFFGDLRTHLKPGGRAYLSWPNFAPAGLVTDLAAQHSWRLEQIAQRSSGSSGFEYYVYLVTDPEDAA